MGTVKWGILGAAKIAKEQVIPEIKKSKNTELYAIASRDISKAEDETLKKLSSFLGKK